MNLKAKYKEEAIILKRTGVLCKTPWKVTPTKDAINKIKYTSNRRFYDLYRHYNYGDKLLGGREYGQVMSALFKTIGEHLVENTSGVYMENLGYFGVMKYPKVPEDAFTLEGGVKMYDGGVVYKPVFFPVKKSRVFEFWTFTGGFSKKLSMSVYDKVYDNHKYKLTYSPIKAVYGHRTVK